MLRPEYIETIFLVASPFPEWPERFCIVTACNPNGQVRKAAENLLLQSQLQQELVENGWWHVEVIGASPDRAHQEPGFAIAISEESGLALGRKYQQEAIYVIDTGLLWLVSCQRAERLKLGWLSERLIKL